MRSPRIWFFFLCAIFSVSTTPHVSSAEMEPLLTKEQQVSALIAEVTRLKERLGGNTGIRSLSGADTEKIINDGISWLIAAQEEDGHFRYEYAPYEDRYLNDDNIVRQAGAFYQLGEALRRGGDNADNTDEIVSTMVRSIGYFASLSREGTVNGKSFRCIVESEDSTRCKLGATALALVGIVSLVEYDDRYSDDYNERIGSYVGFIKAMQKENSGFRNLFDFRSNVQSDKESSFSNGEALLALVRYNTYQPNQTTKNSVGKTFTYLKDEVPFDTALYLWVMAAVADMYAEEPRAEYEDYIRAYTDWRVAGFADRRGTEHNMCAYTEGVTLAYDVLEEFLPATALSPYHNEILFWLARARTLQVGSRDRYRVTFDGGTHSFKVIRNQAQAYGGFLTSESVLTERIDFTQHCLNTYLVWDAIEK